MHVCVHTGCVCTHACTVHRSWRLVSFPLGKSCPPFLSIRKILLANFFHTEKFIFPRKEKTDKNFRAEVSFCVTPQNTFFRPLLPAAAQDVWTRCVELPLVHQLLEDDSLLRRVDQLYFKVQGNSPDLALGNERKPSLDPFDLFYQFREKGVAAHFWP